MELKALLESTLLECGGVEENIASVVDDWGLVVEFCHLYGLTLPVRLLHQCARRNQWQLFVFFIQRYDYPPQLFLPILKVSSRHNSSFN